MNCSQVRDNLAGLLYGDVLPEVRTEVERHLTGCAACRQELAGLAQTRRLLGAVPAPQVRIDMHRLYQQTAAYQTKRLRRWRRVAVAVGSIAALFSLVAFGLRFEARVEAHQLVLRWGAPSTAPESPAAPDLPKSGPDTEVPNETQQVRTMDEQVQVLSKLIRALVDDLRDLDRQRRVDTSQLQARLLAFQHQNLQRCADLQHSIDGLYLLSHKGE